MSRDSLGSAVDATASIWSATTGDPDGGPDVVLVHGSLDRSDGLRRLARRLEVTAQVHRYDRRGYGRSGPLVGPFGLDDHIADLEHVIETASIGAPVVAFGHSYGGNVCLATAERRPDLVAGVAVYESPLSWTPWWPSDTAGSMALDDGSDAADAAERFMRRLVGDERWERLPPSTRAARRAEGVVMVEELADLRRRPAWVAERIHVPVVAMWGEHGAPHHRRAMHHLAEVLPRARTVKIAEARHFGPNTHAAQVASEVSALRAEVSRSG